MAVKGRNILVKAEIAGEYTTLAGIRSRTITINNEQIDITK